MAIITAAVVEPATPTESVEAIPNNSATGGYLLPTPTPTTLLGDALLDFVQAWVVGVTGMAGNLVRPRWQPEPTNIPAFSITWAAVGLIRRAADTFAAEIRRQDQPLGESETRRHEELEFLISFFGPDAMV